MLPCFFKRSKPLKIIFFCASAIATLYLDSFVAQGSLESRHLPSPEHGTSAMTKSKDSLKGNS